MHVKVRLYITIDTEEDDWGVYDRSVYNLTNILQIPHLQNLFDRYDAKPTYLLSYPVVKNPAAVRIFDKINRTGRCELGAHCHPWNTPPYAERNAGESMLINLQEDMVGQKLTTLHNMIWDRFGMKAKAFRAGRYGFGPSVARSIKELGYLVDSSVTPMSDWTSYGGPDFFNAPTEPFRFQPSRILEKDPHGELLEVPVSTGFLQRDRRLCSIFYKRLRKGAFSHFRFLGLLDHLRLLNFRWLSPEMSSSNDMIFLADTLVRQGCTTLNLTFHSPSLLSGKSPFVRTEAERDGFIGKIEAFLDYAKLKDFVFATLSEAVTTEFRK